ncbi:MAG: protein-glutamate O-methyltransferase CheR [Firmicutes bacterium]|nr:protein-glutamate O-methyltransferase CheR [Bacillota bacterium]
MSASFTDKEFQQLTDYIRDNFGINFKKEKQALVIGRLQNVLVNCNIENFSEYLNYVISDKTGEAAVALINKITTNHTFFMREADHFFYFRDVVLPFLSKTVTNKDMRIWCAACSTGEEAYTLAMILNDYFSRDKILWDTKVLATDISKRVLDIAKTGIYSNDRITPLPRHWKSNYFKRYDDENSILNDKIRNDVIYRNFNLMEKTYPFRKKFNVIFCRNVMIYFDEKTKAELVSKFYNQIENGGYLFVGHSESLNRETTKFKYIMPAVYRKVY